MMATGHLFIQPWLHPDETWGGFEVGFSGADEAFCAALTGLAALPEIKSIDHRLQWFIPLVHPNCVSTASAFRDNHGTLFLLQSKIDGDRETWSKIEAELRRTGTKLGLIIPSDAPLPPTGTWSYVVLSAAHARALPAASLTLLATKSNIAIVNPLNRNDFTWAVSNHCTLVSSEYLLGRSAPSKQPDVRRLQLLKLLALVAADAEIHEIEEIFRQEPRLAFGLLRLVNSAAMSLRNPINSFRQAITILGRRHLQRWLQLLVYASLDSDQHPNPLLLQAAKRGHLMEILSALIPSIPEPEKNGDLAFMIGTFSLLDILLNLPMQEIMQHLPLPENARAALESEQGSFGQLLKALRAADNRNFDTASALLSELEIDGNTFTAAQIRTFQWACNIRTNA